MSTRIVWEESPIIAVIEIPPETRDENLAETLAKEIASFRKEYRHRSFSFIPSNYRIAYENGDTENILTAIMAIEF